MKKILALILALALIFCLVPAAFAADGDALAAADTLHALGLFNGIGDGPDGKPIYDLDRAPTRSEAVAMLVRLLGKDAEAKAGTWETPFTDVEGWPVPYVGYAYANGLTKGTSSTTFGGDELVSATQYLTFVLRALGYDSSSDFAWNEAWKLSDEIGLTHGEYSEENNYDFLRADVAEISAGALPVSMNGTETTLADALIEEGVFTEEQYVEATGDEPQEPEELEIVEVRSVSDLLRGGQMHLAANITLTEDVTLTKDFTLDLNGFAINGSIYTTTTLNGDGRPITQNWCHNLTVAPGVSGSLTNGRLNNVAFYNKGALSEITDVTAQTQAGPCISNGGTLGLIRSCTITGETIGVVNYGDIDLIDNCEIVANTFAAVTCSSGVSENDADGVNIISRITNCRMIGTNFARGSGFAGGNYMNGMTVIENCVLIGYGRGGMESYGSTITVRSSVIVNPNDGDPLEFNRIAILPWFFYSGASAPTLENCTLISEDGPCGYYETVSVQAPSGKETLDENVYVDVPFYGSATCKWMKLSEVSADDLSYYTYWTMAA
jgi:hypothetical protein